ncbi:MAG TPA: type I restriction-modification system subunit M N-terminal domain-containing protein, partial [Propioniciclava sp.]|nr:type I restriction-modification system subunit M N-terminal domain-containing protein [Propioniciclava sp.]
MDASQYKDVVLGLIFLKYVSDAFNERRAAIEVEVGEDYGPDELADTLEDPDEYTGHGVFWVDPDAR